MDFASFDKTCPGASSAAGEGSCQLRCGSNVHIAMWTVALSNAQISVYLDWFL